MDTCKPTPTASAALATPSTPSFSRRRRLVELAAIAFISTALYLALQFSGTTADWGGWTAYIAPDWHTALMASANLLVLAAWQLLCICILRRFWFGTLLSLAPWVLLAVAHHAKLSVMGMPLVPLDLRRAWDVIPMGWATLSALARLGVVASAAAVILAAALLDRRLKLARWHWQPRLYIGGIAAAVVLAIPATTPLLTRGGIFFSRRWDWGHCYRTEGFALSFLAFSRDLVFPPRPATPPGYSEETMRDLCSQIATQFPISPANTAAPVRPDVIIIPVESLLDPAWMPKVTFALDPLANLHQLQRECGEIRAISPTFAGNSINTDFEVLTGFDASHLPPEMMAVTDDLERPVPSLATLLKAHGYQTTALIPTPPTLFGHGWFFPVGMGFDRYRDVHSLGGAGVDGVSDLAMADAILQTLSDGSDSPQFVYAQFTRNHYPWVSGKFDHPEALPSSMPACDDASPLRVYLQGVYEADQAIGRLSNALRKRQRPAVLVLFGDHLPGFSAQTYIQIGLLASSDSLGDRYTKMHTTPAVIWSPALGSAPLPQRTLRMNQLPPNILRLAGIEHPFYTGFLAAPDQRACSLLQFDQLHGRRYATHLLAP